MKIVNSVFERFIAKVKLRRYENMLSEVCCVISYTEQKISWYLFKKNFFFYYFGRYKRILTYCDECN